jgi:hypothetical protein
MGSRDCSVGSSQGNPERRVPMAQQCNRSAERRRRGMSPSAGEVVAVVETPSLQCFQRVRGRETRPILQLNLC